MPPLVVVSGYREADKAFRNLSKELSGEFRKELTEAAEPIAAETRSRLSRYQGVSLTTIHPVALARGVAVRQDARKVTGKRGDFGAIQMRALIDSLSHNEQKVINGLERALDKLTDEAGF